MRMFGLTEHGHVLKLEVTDGDSDKPVKTKIIQDAIVLDTEKSTFCLEYVPNKYGDLVMETITENPKDIYDRISKARVELDKRELAFMAHLFLVEKEEYSVEDLSKTTKPKPKRIRNAKSKEGTNDSADNADERNRIEE